ncbi:MAG: hypothetical protein H6636_08320 [Anaerolineales bacterium]|nr:hypothetical protein [Anaerolineales bacterium]
MADETPVESVNSLVSRLLSKQISTKERENLLKNLTALASKLDDSMEYLLNLGNQGNDEERLFALRIVLPILFKEEMEGEKNPKAKGQSEKEDKNKKISFAVGIYIALLGKFISKAFDVSVEYCLATLQEFDKVPWSIQRQVVLVPVLNVLKECDNAELKRALAVWLGQKVQMIADDDDFTLHRRVGDALTYVKDNEKNQEVRDRVREALNKFWEQLTKVHFKNLTAIIEESGATDDEKTQAIRRLSHVNSLGSREAMEYLVKKLVLWIGTKKIRLVELTAEAIRYNRYAVLPLIDEFVKESRKQEAVRDGFQDTFARVVQRFQGVRKMEYEAGEGDDLEEEDPTLKNLRIRRRIARQLADMSDPRFFDEVEELQEGNKDALRKHAIPALARQLPVEDDIEILEDMVRILGYTSEGTTSGREAIDALARAVVGVDRTLNARRRLLDEYYLKPSKAQSENAANILDKAITEARRNLRILQGLNILVFIVGLSIFFGGFVISMINQDAATRLASALTSVGGLAGIVFQLVRRPLDRIQNSMANLVQMETAFTSFIWEQGLNSTYIQSQYVSQGKLSNDDIDETIFRSQKTMALTMELVAIHAETGVPNLVTRIHNLEPVNGVPESEVVIHGQNLDGDTAHYKKVKDGLLAINHIPVNGNSVLAWNADSVKIHIPKEVQGELVWISLFVDGMETNALPFQILRHQNDESSDASITNLSEETKNE